MPPLSRVALLIALTLAPACATPGPHPWTRPVPKPSADTFRFAVIADRTGGHREGVFEDAVRKLNLLHPDFVMSVGDLTEGYTQKPDTIAQYWDEFGRIIAGLDAPFYYLPGNHDISNAVMADAWTKRFGPSYYHFVHQNVLFLCLNSEDPPGGHLGDEQIAYALRTLERYPHVRWTFVLLHEPLWTYPNENGWNRVETALHGRPCTIFAGHMHAYLREQRDGHWYYTLATTGGASTLKGPNAGEVDHVAWVTMADNNPKIANLTLDGIWDDAVYTPEVRDQLKSITSGVAISSPPLIVGTPSFRKTTAAIVLANASPWPLTVHGTIQSTESLQPYPSDYDRTVPPNATETVSVQLHAPEPLPTAKVPPLVSHWTLTAALPQRPPLKLEGDLRLFVTTDPPSPDQLAALSLAELTGLAKAFHGVGNTAATQRVVDALYSRAISPAAIKEITEAARAVGVTDGLAQRLGFVNTWSILGPFPWKESDGFPAGPTGGVPTVDLTATYRADDQELRWRRHVSTHEAGLVNLAALLGQRSNATAYAYTELRVPQDTDAVLRAGSDDGIKIWVNGAVVHANTITRGVVIDQDAAPVKLHAGVNTVLVQVTQGIEGWGFCLRATEPDGAPLKCQVPR